MLTLRSIDRLRTLELLSSTTIQLEANNRLLTDDENRAGNYSLPFTLPLTDANRQALDWPDQLDGVGRPRRRLTGWQLLDDEQPLADGDLVIRETGADLKVVFEFGTTAIRQRLDATRLLSLELGGERVLFAEDSNQTPVQYILALRAAMTAINAQPNPDFVFGPHTGNGIWINSWSPNFTWFDPQTGDDGGGPGFQFNLPLTSPSSPYGDFVNGYRIAPLPRLRYVIETAFRELGIAFESDFFDGQTSQLVVLSTATLDRIEPGPYGTFNVWQNRFRLADHLPDLSLLELLEALATTFDLLLDVTMTGTVRLLRGERIVRATGAVDLTRRLAAAPVVRSLDNRTAYRIAYEPGELRVFDAADVLGTVATVADLPTYPQLPDTDKELVWFVEAGQGYWIGTIFETLPNQFSVYFQLRAVKIPSVVVGTGEDGTEPTTRAPGIGHVYVRPGGYGLTFTDGAGYAPVLNLTERQKTLRLAFWRGDTPAPLLSIEAVESGRPSFEYSLHVEGAAGLAEQWLRPLLDVRGSGILVKAQLYADGPQLRRLLALVNSKIALNGRHYLIRRLNMTLPPKGPHTVELLPI